jgi:hypothetical protein
MLLPLRPFVEFLYITRMLSSAAGAGLADYERKARPRFYVWFSFVSAVTTFVGFWPSFWAPMLRGAHVPSPGMEIHGLLFSLWPLYMLFQTRLVISGRTTRHRDVGLVGVALATAMCIFGVIAAIDQTQRAATVGALDAGLRFMILPIAEIVLFAGFLTFALVNLRCPEWHKRLLVMATTLLMEAPIGRIGTFYLAFHGKLPVPAGMPSPPPPLGQGFPILAILDPFILAAIIYDWRTRGRPHPAYLLGASAIVVMRLSRGAISHTSSWYSIARWIYSLAG